MKLFCNHFVHAHSIHVAIGILETVKEWTGKKIRYHPGLVELLAGLADAIHRYIHNTSLDKVSFKHWFYDIFYFVAKFYCYVLPFHNSILVHFYILLLSYIVVLDSCVFWYILLALPHFTVML